MRRVIIVQTRMTSTRLSGKVLLDLAGRPMLARQIHRLKACRFVDEIVVGRPSATVTMTRWCGSPNRKPCGWYRGSEHDVLRRYVEAARDAGADVIIRITADCPLIDPQETDRVVEALVSNAQACDYASNVVERPLPRGLDAEAMFADTLERLDRLATSASAREHVTSFMHAAGASGAVPDPRGHGHRQQRGSALDR